MRLFFFDIKRLRKDQRSAVAVWLTDADSSMTSAFMAQLCSGLNEQQACNLIMSLPGQDSKEDKGRIRSQ